MGERVAFILLWIAFFFVGLWVLLRSLPTLIKFFRHELERAKDRVTDTETMVIKVKKESKKKPEVKENDHA